MHREVGHWTKRSGKLVFRKIRKLTKALLTAIFEDFALVQGVMGRGALRLIRWIHDEGERKPRQHTSLYRL